MLWVNHYIARYKPQYLKAYIDWLMQKLKHFLDHGILNLTSSPL
jgi:hypothetical protein